MLYLLALSLLLLVAALALLWFGWQAQQRTGLPRGEVIYQDTSDWQRVEKPLLSRRFGLVGRPDYLVQVAAGGKTITVPVEVKSRKRPRTLPEGHLLQLAAYCLLVEDRFQTPPPYGLLRYADATVKIPFTPQLRSQLLQTVEAMRQAQSAPEVARNHKEPNRCRRCGYQLGCGTQALVQDAANGTG
jgi:CRISPR-associated exonuclease Cas4